MATANHPTHVLIELSDSSGRPCSFQQNVTAELECISESPHTALFDKLGLLITIICPSQYKVSYTAVSRGQHKLHIQVNNREIGDSPFIVTVYPNPSQLSQPARVVTGLNRPYGIGFNSRGEMFISDCGGHQVSVFDIERHKIRMYGSRGCSPHQMKFPAGIAIDSADNIYVSSDHKLQKFTSTGELIKCIGQRGSKEGEFYGPREVTIYHDQVYVCDSSNHRIQVFDLDLNFVRSVGSRGKGRGVFNAPFGVKFDNSGNMYVAEFNNKRVQVMDINGCFIRAFGHEGEEKLKGPSALHIVDKYVYVSDFRGDRIVVYETSGQFVTSFGRCGHEEGEFDGPRCIASCNGFLYVCDYWNRRVQIF